MLAIQRLVRGDDGLTKVIYIDLQTLMQIDDLTGYQVVSSGDLGEPEPVESVDTPDVPSKVQPPLNPQQEFGDGDPAVKGGYAEGTTTPDAITTAPNQSLPKTVQGTPGSVPNDVSPPSRVEPDVQADLGPLGGIRTNQGSILPELDYTRFDESLRDWSTPAPVTDPGSPNVSDLERTLENRNELENIKDNQTPAGVSPDQTKDDTYTPSVDQTPSSLGGSLGPSTGVATHPNAPDRVKDDFNVGTPNTVSNPDRVKDDSYTPSRGFATHPNALDRTKDDFSGMGTTVAGRPERTGSLPGYQTNPNSLDRTKDDASRIASGTPARGIAVSPNKLDRTKDDFAPAFAGAQPSGSSVFDTPNSSKNNEISKEKTTAQKSVEAARTPSSSRTGFVSAGPNRSASRTTTFLDAAGYSKVDRKGSAAWRNNNPGNIEATGWTKSQPGYIGAAGGIQSPSGHLKANERFAVFDTMENGIAAQRNLIEKSYSNMSFTKMMEKYAPTEYDKNGNVVGATSAQYAQTMADSIGVDPNTTTLNDLTPSQRQTVIDNMLDNREATQIGTESVSLTDKGVNARDNYTGPGTGSDTPSERNASSRPSVGTAFGAGGSRGIASNVGRDDSAGAGRGSGGSSSGARSSTGGIGSDRAASAGSGSDRGGIGSGIGRNDSAGAGRGSSPGGPSSSGSRSSPSHSQERERDTSASSRSSSTASSGTTSGHGPGIGRA